MTAKQVFLSWSGTRSRSVAIALKKWLEEQIFESLAAWMSDRDIAMGSLNHPSIEENLDRLDAAILVLTVANQSSPWVNYEAGALSRQFKANKRLVIPLLIDGESMDELRPPLNQFQGQTLTREGVHRILETLCEVQGIDKQKASVRLESHWDSLESEITRILADSAGSKAEKPTLESTQEQLNRIERFLIDSAAPFDPRERHRLSPHRSLFLGSSRVPRMAVSGAEYFVTGETLEKINAEQPSPGESSTEPVDAPATDMSSAFTEMGMDDELLRVIYESLAEFGLEVQGVGGDGKVIFVVPSPMPTPELQLELERRIEHRSRYRRPVYVGPNRLSP